MKKIILTLIAVVAMSATSMAQQNGGRRQMGGQGFNPAEMIQRRTDQMVKQYKLTDEQATALKALNEKFMGQRGQRSQVQNGQGQQRPQMNDSVRAQRQRGQRNAQANGQNGQRGQRGNRMGQGGQRGMGGFGFNNEEYTNELKKIFTEEQFKAYEKNQKDMQARFQNMRNNGNRRQGGGFGGGFGGGNNNGFGNDNDFQD